MVSASHFVTQNTFQFWMIRVDTHILSGSELELVDLSF